MQTNIRQIVLEILGEINEGCDFENCDDFFEEELIDSMGVITMLSMLEDAFSITILPEDITADNFINVGSIVELVEKYEG